MNNRRGFTLIEVIVSLTLIILIAGATTTVILLNNNKKEKKIDEVTRKIQEAAGVYLSVNKKLDGNIENNIVSGGTGYVITLETLLNEGYISDSYISTLEKNIKNFNKKEHYMLAGIFSDDQTQCDNEMATITIEPSYKLEKGKSEYFLCNFTTPKFYIYYDLNGGNLSNKELAYLGNKGFKHTIISDIPKKAEDEEYTYDFVRWNDKKDCSGTTISNEITVDKNTVIYACYKSTKKVKAPVEPTYKEIVLNARFTNNFDKIAVSEEWCKNNPGYDTSKIVCDENGIFTYYDNKNDITYYYSRGAIKNNYLKFKNKTWRIVWISDDGTNKKMKIVMDDETKIKIENKEVALNDELIKVTASDIYEGLPYGYYQTPHQYYPIHSDREYDYLEFDSFNTNFYYLKSSNALTSEIYYSGEVYNEGFYYTLERYRYTYDLDKILKNSYSKYIDGIGHMEGNRNYNKDKNIYYDTMYKLENFDEEYIIKANDICGYNIINSDYVSEFNSDCEKLDSSNITEDSRVTYLTFDELKKAGVGNYIDDSQNLDNYLIPENNIAYNSSDIYRKYSSDKGESYYVSSKGLKSEIPFREKKYNYSDGANTSHGCYGTRIKKYNYIFFKNDSCGNEYCQLINPEYSTYYNNSVCSFDAPYPNIKEYRFTFYSNAVKPAIVIDLNKINLSNNKGTKDDPYILKK